MALISMKKLLLCLLFLLIPAVSEAAESLPPTLKPEAQHRDHAYTWETRHEAVKERHRNIKPEYVLIGDSITHHWAGEPADGFGQYGKDSWFRLFGPHAVTNMGFGFDYVDNAYYRIQQGELDGISPRVIILMIGTNNLGHRKDTPGACAANTKALISLIRRKCPSSKILLLGILPRKEKDLIDAIRETNRQLSRLADKRHVFFSNPGLVLQEGNSGTLRKACTMDGIHLSSTGYSILADELADLLHRMDPQYKGGKVPRPAKIDGMDPDQVHLVAIGDSITDNYRKDNLPCQDFLPIWKKYYAPYNAFNAGFNGNTTDDVLARIGGKGILDHVSPKVVQIMIGTNDTGRGNTEEETFNGICRVVNKVHSKLPHASILLVGILPSDIYNWHVAAAAYPDKKFKRDMAVNDRLARLYAKNPFVTFLDIRDVFLDGNGKVREELFCDPAVVVINGKKAGPLHPNTEGQRLMAEAIQPTLARLMKKHSK